MNLQTRVAPLNMGKMFGGTRNTTGGADRGQADSAASTSEQPNATESGEISGDDVGSSMSIDRLGLRAPLDATPGSDDMGAIFGGNQNTTGGPGRGLTHSEANTSEQPNATGSGEISIDRSGLRAPLVATPGSDENSTPLSKEIAESIQMRGPITVAEYMNMCLSHPR